MPHTINNTSDIINKKITTYSLKGLILYIKQHIIQWYKHTRAIVNCYICIIYYILPYILYLGYAWRSKYYVNQIRRNIPNIINAPNYDWAIHNGLSIEYNNYVII